MKKHFFLLATIVTLISCDPAKQISTPLATVPVMSTALDSFSYAIGLSISNFYKEQGVDSIENYWVMQALTDSRNVTAIFSDEQINTIIIDFMDEMRAKKAAAVKKEGTDFLAENKTREGVVELPSGLQYQIIKAGNGKKPGPTDKVRVHYTGKLINGTIFDSSVERGEPIEFNLNGVIKGWTEALQLMSVGSKWNLYIPSDLAYGDNAAGPHILPGSTLIFEVELLDIVQ